VFVGLFCIDSITFSRSSPACSSCSLFSTSLRNWCNNQRIHTKLRVVNFYLGEPWINHIENTIDCYTCFCYVCSDNTFSFALRSWLKNTTLQLTRKSTIDRQNYELRDVSSKTFQPLIKNLAGRVDFFLTCQEK